MKKIICVNNQEDLINSLFKREEPDNTNVKINNKNSFKETFKQKNLRQENYQKNIKENSFCIKKLIVVDCLLIDNLGIPLLKETINYYNTNNYHILLNTGKSLPYLLFAIESGFNFVFTTIKNTDINNIKELAQNYNCKIFNFTENIFECLIVS